MNVGLVVCLAVLIGFLELVRYGLYALLDAYGFSTFMVICVGLTLTNIALAFLWDWHEARR
jgi:hypothetical protein